MYFADFLTDHGVPDMSIRDAFAAALAVGASDVSVWPRGRVTDRSAMVIVQTADIGGDFPFQMSVTFSDALPVANRKAQLIDVVRALARQLHTIVVTDDVGVNPAFDDDFLIVGPDGTTQIVQADLDGMDDDMVVLTPDSQTRYQAMREQAELVVGHQLRS